MMIPGLAVSVIGQAAPASAQDSSRFTIRAELGQTAPAGQTPPAAPQPTTSPTAPLATGQKPPTGDEQAVIQEERTSGPTKKITLDEAVQLALENNLDVKIQRIQPAISDVAITAARAVWLPSVNGSTDYTNQTALISNRFGAQDSSVSNKNFQGSMGLQQALPWSGTQYTVGWQASRVKTSNAFENPNPTLRSNLAFSLTQPLLRNFGTDSNRTQYVIARTNRQITDIQLHQQIVSSSAQVRQGYWDLVYARANLRVLQQTLDLARQTLKDNRTRVEVGTMAPIDIVEAQAEVARNEQLVIGAAADIDQAEDALRALIYNQNQPEFWTMNLDTSDEADVPTSTADVDIETAVRAALDKRTDLLQQRKSLEASEVNLKFYRNQILPTVNLLADYSVSALGGVTALRAPGDTSGPILGYDHVGFGNLFNQMFGRDNPTWSFGLNVTYPLGTNAQKAQLMRARLQYDSDKLSLQNRELAAATQVRSAGRTLNTNRRQVTAAQVSRELFERRLEAAQKKFAVGLATSFEVLQAQRDLANARNQELQAVINYVKSRVQFETVQEIGTANSNASGPVSTGGGGGNGGNGGNGGQGGQGGR